ncbi:glycosyltransferase [Methylorubrum populi]|uniref:glycosyltransferase n=1 Tax=Methylorubrum populi TaxID=223967 RepID=UPI00114D9EE5|nr:glycosyltransferase [Methylorubrum populi]QDI82180.1 glycosyltransferase [Methylorubrum populi]
MPVVSLRPISEDGDLFELRFVVPSYPITIDFIGEKDTVQLHISIRPAEQVVVLNDTLNGHWGAEIRSPFSNEQGTPCALEIRINGFGLNISTGTDVIYAGTWRSDLRTANELLLSSEDIYVRRSSASANLLKEGSRIGNVTNSAAKTDFLDRALADILLPAISETLKNSVIPKLSNEIISINQKSVSRLNLRTTEYRRAGVASIPGRVSGLEQAVSAMSAQVDEVDVFLNGYDKIPDFLKSVPSINVFCSQDYDDIGDAGKFFTFDPSRNEFYFSFDDDIVYPNDYADRLTEAAYHYNVPCGVHGSLLRLDKKIDYYDTNDRYVFHFRDKNLADRRVHVLGTGTLCIPPGIFKHKPPFYFRNMADIWIARQLSKQGTGQICVARAYEWLKPYATGDDSIYSLNLKRTTQTLLVNNEIESFVPSLRTIKISKPKIVVGIKTFNRLHYLKQCIDSFVRTASLDYDVVLIVADDGSSDGTVSYLQNLRLPFEVHAIFNKRAYVSGQFNSIVDKSLEINADFIFILDDDVVFKKSGWMNAYYDAAMNSGYHHLCHFNLPHYEQLCAKRRETFPPDAQQHTKYPLVAYKSVENCMGALFTVTPEVIRKVGYADEVNFFVRGLWHVDYSARCARAGYNEYQRFFDIAGSNVYIELQNTLKGSYTTSISWDAPEFKKASAPAERERRWSILKKPSRVFVSREEAKDSQLIDVIEEGLPLKIDSFFDRIFVLNLDRRADRLEIIDRRLRRLDISYERIAAVDGREASVNAEWEEYASKFRPEFGKRMSSRKFYLEHVSDTQRVQHMQAVLNGPVLRTPGAWGYAKTYQNVLRTCIDRAYKRVLILDDDGVFHKDFRKLFTKAVSQLPCDWKILQLGTMQYDWDWTRPYSENLYLPDGVLVGSHAVGLTADVIPIMLEHIERFNLPVDIGALHYAAREFREKSFVAVPNLIIQDQRESDINSSEVAEAESAKVNNIYRWNLADYDFN